jgi:single-stranded-DNA-specific exonuclease
MAEVLAGQLEEANRRRQQVEAEILEQARIQAFEQASRPALVLWHQDWHPGVVGIVAGRLAGEFGRPAVLIALSGEEGRGSARSGAGFDLVSMFSECAGHLLRYGGHKEAAGLAIHPDHLEAFREDFCRCAAQAGGPEEQQYIAVAEVAPDELSLELARELEQLQPFGQSNPEPVFLAQSLQVVSSRLVGSKSNHLQLKLKKTTGAAGDTLRSRGGAAASQRRYHRLCFHPAGKQLAGPLFALFAPARAETTAHLVSAGPNCI